MFIRLKRKLLANKKNNNRILFIFFVLSIFTSIGYSAVQQNLMITGEVNYEAKTNTLYDVLKGAAAVGTYAQEYTGTHQDSISGNGSKKIYHWYGSNATDGTAIQDMNNVIFAGHCWQMIRTTDTGGVKMIYNGEANDNQCLNTRGNHIGYGTQSTANLSSSYYYGTDYTYDSANSVFSLSGTLQQATWGSSTWSSLIGKYTCRNSSSTGTCATLYYVLSYSSDTVANVIPLNSTSHYSQFGKATYNPTYNSLGSVGYMYNTLYLGNNTLSYGGSEGVLGSQTLSVDYYYGTSVKYSSSKYSLVSPSKVSSTSDFPNLVGKYTVKSTSSSGTATQAFYIAGVSGTTGYHIQMVSGNLLSYYNYSLTYGDSYTDNGNGTYTINTPRTTINRSTWYNNYSAIKNKYACKNASNNSCSDMMYLKTTSATSMSYSTTSQAYKFGNSYSWDGSKYTLSNGTVNLWDIRSGSAHTTSVNTAHYTCINSTGQCTTLAYVARANGTNLYYIELTNGKSINNALTEMLSASNVNTNSSSIKVATEEWYKKYLLGYSDYLEDTIFCNDRTISSRGGFDPASGDVTEDLQFLGSSDLSCPNVTDRFSTLNNQARLEYKVGLLTLREKELLGNSNTIKTGSEFWTGTPHNGLSAIVTSIDSYGNTAYSTATSVALGLRPVISLIPDIQYISGDGSMSNPYIIDAAPATTPSIRGGTTKIYGSSATTLTCKEPSIYEDGSTIYYSFGYATTATGTPGSWTTASTTPTLTVSATEYVGQRWYSCRTYAKKGGNTTSTTTSTTTTELKINNASLTFNATANGGTLSGTRVLYTKSGATGVYTTLTGTTAGTIPTASKTDYTFEGWYTQDQGGVKVLNADGSFTGTAVADYTTASAWAVTENKTLYAKYSSSNSTYTLNYTMNGGEAISGAPTSANYGTAFGITKPTKTFTINIDANSQHANITLGGNAVTSVSGAQTFAGWTASNLNTSTAKYGSTSSPSTSWTNASTKVGASYATTYFLNLQNMPDTVELIANWTATAITLPKAERTGRECTFNTKADGSGTSYASEGSYTPSATTGNVTLYVRCVQASLMQHDSDSTKTFGKSISRDSFESITTLNHRTVPANAIDSWDVSAYKNGTVMAWYLDEDNDSKYELYIGQNGGVTANEDSSYTFRYFQNIDSLDLTYFDTTIATDMKYMFYFTGFNSESFTLDLGSRFDTSSVTNMSAMFYGTGYKSQAFTLNLGNKFNTSNVTNMSYMFSYTGFHYTNDYVAMYGVPCPDLYYITDNYFLESGPSTITDTPFTLNLGSLFDTSNVTNMSYMFNYTGYRNHNFTLNLGSNFDTSNVTDMAHMFDHTGHYSKIFTLDLGSLFDTSNVTNMSSMFDHIGNNSSTFTLSLGSKFYTSNVTDMNSMFAYAGAGASSFTLNLGSNFNTSNVVDMSSMFYATGGWNTSFILNLGSNFNTSNVTNMAKMFYGLGYKNTSCTLSLGNYFDTSKVTNMSYMFKYTGDANSAFSLDLGNLFVFSAVTDYPGIFDIWKTTNRLYVKNSTVRSWIINNAGNSNLTTSNVLLRS